MAHIFRSGVFGADDEFLRIFHVFCRDLSNFGRHCCGKKKHFPVLRHVRQNVVDVVHETHVEHFVGLVKNHGVDIFEFYHSAVDKVYQTSGSCHYDLDTLLKALYLAFDA